MKDSHTPARAVRVPDDLWKAAQAAADGNGESVSDVIRKALERYVKAAEKRKEGAT